MRRSLHHRAIRWLFYRCLRWLGIPLRDPHTGAILARVLILPWRGRLRIFGLPDYQPIRITPRFIKPGLFQSIALQAELLPFPNEPSIIPQASALLSLKLKPYNLNLNPSLTALLAHQSPAFVENSLSLWFQCGQPPASLLLLHISTEGLITPEATEAYRKGQTLYDFIMELRPDLIAHGRYYLDDPDGLQKKINDAAHAGEDLEYRDLRLTHRGLMRGAGPHFQASYETDDASSR